ncbi:MAG: molecular chaperone DnaJ [Microthrixaceae bacterium]
MADLYEILGVDRGASDDDIKKAYRKAARDCHPDANPGDADAEARFKELSAAYEVLSNPDKRARYDRFGSADGFDMGDPFGSGEGFGDLFDAFFGGGSPFGGGRSRGPRAPSRGPDLEVTASIEFIDALFGVETDVAVRTAVACETCEATGATPGTSATTCDECGGSGEVRAVRNTVLGQIVSASPCRRCEGSGQVILSPCESCKGEGRIVTDRSYTVEVPAGVDDGSTLRLTGRGAVGPRGAGAGDLYVRLRVQSDPRFERDGNNLVHRLRLPLTQAALGAHIAVDTPEGRESLEVPNGTQPGRVFKLRGHGVPHLNGRGRGDLLVVVDVEVPTSLDEDSERLLRELAEHRGEEVAPPAEGLMSKIRSAFS